MAVCTRNGTVVLTLIMTTYAPSMMQCLLRQLLGRQLWVLVLCVSGIRTGARTGTSTTTTIIQRERAAGHPRISLL